ncbi:hypothetical protein [Mangrovibacterium sp.]|uniref:hypothetical protein n=1 Tax=Mangrovibacterium sp. TaxID=1961364 RepID=UPI0035662D3B
MKKEHPILFSLPMVQAILEDRKKQTRRICKHQHWTHSELTDVNINKIIQKVDRNVSCPYGQPGDLLWVRETFTEWPKGEFQFRASTRSGDELGKWKPSIHMPKAAARIWLEITEVKVERLQAISEGDAKAEGIKLHSGGQHYLDYIAEAYNTTQFIYRLRSAKDSFKTLWQLVNERNKSFIEVHGIRWSDNPWVWVVKFKVISTNGKPEICYKTNEVCKYDCKGLCRESM